MCDIFLYNLKQSQKNDKMPPPPQCLLALPPHGLWTLERTLLSWPGSLLCTTAGETSWATMLRRYQLNHDFFRLKLSFLVIDVSAEAES